MICKYNLQRNRIVRSWRYEVGKIYSLFTTITDLEADPESKGRQLLLAEQIETTDANQDTDIFKIAQKLTEALQSTETGRKAIGQVSG